MKKTRIKYFVMIAAIIVSVFATISSNTTTYAATTDTKAGCEASGGAWKTTATGQGGLGSTSTCVIPFQKTLSSLDQLRSYALYNGISSCSRQHQWAINIATADVDDPSTWLGTSKVATGYIVDNTDAQEQCNTMVRQALTLWGITTTDARTAFLEGVGYKLSDETKCTSGQISNSTTCTKTGKKNYSVDPTNNTTLNGFQNYAKTVAFGSQTPTLAGNDGLLYLRGQTNLELATACNATAFKKVSDLTDAEKKTYPANNNGLAVTTSGGGSYASSSSPNKDYLIVSIVDGSNWTKSDWVYKIDKANWSKSITLNEKPSGGASIMSCVDIAKSMAGYADGIVQDVKVMKSRSQDPSLRYGDIVNTPGTAAAAAGGKGSGGSGSAFGGSDTPSSCTVEGIGWIICPAVSFMGNVLGDIFKGIKPFMQIDIELFNNGSGTYIGWQIFRTIANVAFVIAFLIIIFSQLTGVGVSNYGVKKMLPRLVIAAILVNVSFFICQLAVDISNVLGVSLKTVFDNIANQVGVHNSNDASANGFGITAIVGLVLGAAVVGYLAIGILIPVLIGALVAVLMIILILILRKAIIVLLIVVSPLAFVAYLLPNTEGLFTKWRKAFMSLLLLFPIIAVVFGAASLASQILLSADPGNVQVQIAALGAATIPFFVVPSLLKGSLSTIGSLGNKLNGFGGKISGGLSKAGSKGYANTALSRGREIRKQGRAAYRNERFAKAVAAGGIRSKLAKGANITGAQKYANKALERNAVAASEEADSKAVKEEALILSREATSKGNEGQDHVKGQLKQALINGDSVRARAAYSTLTSMGAGGVEDARDVLSNTTNSSGQRYVDADKELGDDMKQHIIRNHSDMKSTDNRQMNWATNSGNLESAEHFGNLTDGQAATQTPASIKASNLSPERAYRILQDKNISPNIKDPQRDALKEKAAGYAPAVAPSEANPQASETPNQTSATAEAPVNTSSPLTGGGPVRDANAQTGSGPGGLIVPEDSNFTPPDDLRRR